MFVDIAQIKVKAGNGGDGAVSFHRDVFTANGGPDGGNGGRGGSIIFKADSNLSTLSEFRYKKKFFAKNGQNGASGKRSGKKGEDIIIKVPYGTLIKNAETGKLIADVSTDEDFIIAKGGKGGAGNMNFAGPVKQTPRFAKPGEKTPECMIKLELKLLADVGLVGYPNVGKSTIISMVSHAKPQIANYHFTTLAPILGVVRYDENNSFVMADIPGLIEGAWQGIGLGHQFLRHVERCRLLVHVVDISGCEGRNPCDDFDVINNELVKFSADLAKRPMIVVGNKCDVASDDQIETFKNYVQDLGYEFLAVSASCNQGVKQMLDKIAQKLSELPPAYLFTPDGDCFEPIQLDDEPEIKNVNGVYYVKAAWLDKLIDSVNFEDYDSMQYFQDSITKSGLTEALKSAGAKQGDVINIKDTEFDFFD